MTTQSKTAQNPGQTTTQAPKLTPDFSHRLAYTHLDNTQCLTDSIILMADRLSGILMMLSVSFAEGVRLSDDSMLGVIDAAIQEAEDIRSLARAYDQAIAGGVK